MRSLGLEFNGIDVEITGLLRTVSSSAGIRENWRIFLFFLVGTFSFEILFFFLTVLLFRVDKGVLVSLCVLLLYFSIVFLRCIIANVSLNFCPELFGLSTGRDCIHQILLKERYCRPAPSP
jgi:hypothetical protein